MNKRNRPHPDSKAHKIVELFDAGHDTGAIRAAIDTKYHSVVYRALDRWRPGWREIVAARREREDNNGN